MLYEDVKTLFLSFIQTPNKAEPPYAIILNYLLNEENPKLTPAMLFKGKSVDDKQLIKYFLLLLAIQYPEYFDHIRPDCLYMSILNTQRRAHTNIEAGRTKSSRDFQWIMESNKISRAEPTPFIHAVSNNNPILQETTEAHPVAHMIFERVKSLYNLGQTYTGSRVLLYLIHLHDQQRLNKAYPTLKLLSEACARLADFEMTNYIQSSSAAAFTSHINFTLRADFLSPKQDMALTIACMKHPHKQQCLSQHEDAHLLFSRLYDALPLSEQKPVLFSWLKQPNLFNDDFPEIQLQIRLLNSAIRNFKLSDDEIYSRLTLHCIDYLRTEDDHQRNTVKEALERLPSPEAACLRLQIQLLEGEFGVSVPLENLGNTNLALQLQASLNYQAANHVASKIDALKANDSNHPELETQIHLHKALKNAVADIIEKLINSSTTLTLSQLRSIITQLFNLYDTDRMSDLGNALLNEPRIRSHFENTPEFQYLFSYFALREEKFEAACSAILKAIHLRPLHSSYYFCYATIVEETNAYSTAAQAYRDCLKAAFIHIFPTIDTPISTNKEIIKIIFSKDLSWLNKHFPEHAGLMHRGALLHWHQSQVDRHQAFHQEAAKNIRAFYKNFPYETFKTLTEGWPDAFKPHRFDALLTLANTLNVWRCYKVLFLNPDFIAERNADELYRLIEALPEKRLQLRALDIALTKNTQLSEKLCDYAPKLRSLKNALTQNQASIREESLFQPYENIRRTAESAISVFNQL